jgi:hypothetical protein
MAFCALSLTPPYKANDIKNAIIRFVGSPPLNLHRKLNVLNGVLLRKKCSLTPNF